MNQYTGSIKEWIEGFEKELNRRFEINLKVLALDRTNLRSVASISAICSGISGVPEKVLQSATRKRYVVEVRQIIMWLARKYTKATEVQVGNYFNRDHTTVIHAVQTVNDRIDTNDESVVVLLGECENKVKEIFNYEIQN